MASAASGGSVFACIGLAMFVLSTCSSTVPTPLETTQQHPLTDTPALIHQSQRVSCTVQLDIAQVFQRLHERLHVPSLHGERHMSVHGQSTGLCLFDDRRKDLGRNHLVDLQKVDACVGEARYVCPGGLHIRVGNP